MRGWKRWSLVLVLVGVLTLGEPGNGGGSPIEPVGHANQRTPALTDSSGGGHSSDTLGYNPGTCC